MTTHVVIATTEGYAYVQGIIAEEAGVQSVLCLDGTTQVLQPVSAAYHAFVCRGSGVIARDFGHSAYRVDLSARVDQGSSWQLPLYLAHDLLARGDLGNGKPQRGDRVLWATGEVDVELAVRPVAGVPQKLAHAIAPVRALRERGIEVRFLVPTDNVGESAGQAEELGGVSGVTRLADVLPLSKVAPGGAARTAPSPAVVAATAPKRRRWLPLTLLALVLLLIAVGLALSGLFPRPPGASLDLDDFGGGKRDLAVPD
jgi:hypothetical protein